MKLSFLLPVAVAVTFSTSMSAQKIPVNTKFGSVSDEELEMTVYEPDTSAAALFLYKIREVEIGFDIDSEGYLVITKTNHIRERVKILKESGKSYPSYSIPYSLKSNPHEAVSGIKAVTFNLENGNIVQSKLSKKMIFDEPLSGKDRIVKFAPENVRVGSVVEVEYTVRSNGADIGRVVMQGQFPINYEKSTVSYADFFSYKHLQKGYVRMDYTLENTNNTKFMRGGLQLDMVVVNDIYTGTDIPAMKKTSFSYCPSQYLSSVEYELYSFIIPGSIHKTFNQSWESVDELFMEEGLFKQLSTSLKFKDEILAAAKSADDDAGKIAAVREVVLSKVRWNDDVGLFPDASRALKTGEGDTADMNAVMASALSLCGFTAEPVLIRPRSSGSFTAYQISTRAYKAMILKVSSPGGESYYLDASDDFGYLNILDPDYLVGQARLLHPDGVGEWVDLTDIAAGRFIENIEMSVTPSGQITGNVSITTTDEFAYDAKMHYDGFKTQDEYIEEQEEDTGVKFVSFEVSGHDDWSNEFAVKYEFETEADCSSNMIYVRPFLDKFHSASSFRDEKRTIPVDFRYRENIRMVCKIAIPDGYVVEQLPAITNMKSIVADSQIIMHSQEVGNLVLITYRFSRKNNIITEDGYSDLRAYWQQLCNIYNSTIVLKKAE